MVLCWIALPIFALLGIFSFKYRQLTKDSLECLFKTVTLRKCESGLDDKIRSDITATFLKYSPPTAKFFYKNYRVISWIVLIIFLWSTYMGGVGIYNYIQHGNCNGPNSNNICIINELIGGENESFQNCMVANNMTEEECRIHCGLE